jgi:two-component system cell cycle sensor histidine kinase/response regulator CckA
MTAFGEGDAQARELAFARARVAELEAALAETHRTTDGLRESKQWLETLLGNAPDSIIVVTPDGKMLYSNRAAAGNRIEDVIGASALRYIVPEQVPKVRAAFESVAATGNSELLEATTVFSTIWETRIIRLPGGDSPPKLIVIGTEVTDRKRAEEQLRQAQKMEAIGELTAGIAHNFNNLLTAIIPGIQLAIARPGPLQVEWLRDAEYAARRAAELVQELMLFARHGKSAPRSPVDVRELLNRTVSLCRATFDGGLAVELVDSSTASTIDAQGGQLEQVFLNICFNARDALDALEPSATKDRHLRIELDAVSDETMAPKGRWVRVRFSDNGAGMSDEVRARIFEPFFTTKEAGRGTGLGLATAYAIVSDHGGKLLCESTPAVGTTFTVLLPAP